MYERWVERGYFEADPKSDKPPFCIVIPPPNVTGSLHIGHAFEHTLIDILVRRRRMQGYDTLCLPGMDHASIAVHALVEQALVAEGTSRRELGREAFLERTWEWKAEHGGAILAQMRRLGESVDWTPRALHDGRGQQPRRPHHVQAALRRRPDLPRRADGQLVAGDAQRALRHRGRAQGGRRRAGLDPLRRRGRRGRRRHHAGRDDAGRHRRRRAPRRRALPRTWSAARSSCRWSGA